MNKGRRKRLSLYQSKRNRTHYKKRRRRYQKNINDEHHSHDEDSTDDSSTSTDLDQYREYHIVNDVNTGASNTPPLTSQEGHNVHLREPSYSEEEDDFCEVCVKKLSSEHLWNVLVPKLHTSNNLVDFMTFIESLEDGSISMDNIVFVLLLERARFGKLKNTCSMRYRKLTKRFWSIVYRLCKSTGLKFFGGPKNWGDVVMKRSERSVYKGCESKINFAVPDEKTIRHSDNKLPKVIPPGIIHSSLELLKNEQNIVLMADGKLIGKGLGDNFTGDINLFGHESKPNIKELQSALGRHLKFISDSISIHRHLNKDDKTTNLKELAVSLTKLVSDIKATMTENRKKLKRAMESENISEKTISKLRTHLYTASLWIRKAIQLNVNIMNILCNLQGNAQNFSTCKNQELCSKGNMRLLQSASYVAQNIDPTEFPHLMKRGSDEWLELKKECLISSSLSYFMLGLGSREELTNSYNALIRQNYENITLGVVDYQPSIDALATMSNVLLPGLYPTCCVAYEEGIRFLDGDIRQQFICSDHILTVRYVEFISILFQC